MMRRTIMTNDIDYGPYEPAELPAPVKRYLEAHQLARDEDAAAATFAPGARVVDEKIEYRSADAIGGWLRKATGQYTYTTDLTGQRTDGPRRWAVRAHLDEDFPGAVRHLHTRRPAIGDLNADT